MALDKQFDKFFKQILFLWLPPAVIILIVKKWLDERRKKQEATEE